MSEDAPIAVGVLGATGRMGRMVIAEIAAGDGIVLMAAAASERSPLLGTDAHALCALSHCGVPVEVSSDGCFAGCDVVIDFSQPDALMSALPHLGRAALVSGTTGLTPEQERALDDRASQAPVLWASNFSVGVTVLLDLVRRAAAAMPGADIEIVEIHHRHKRDAPSGTARSLAEAVARGRGSDIEQVHGRHGLTGERPQGPIGMHALRGGDVVGEHTVWLLADGERLMLSHSASSRATFAAGAVRAARLLVSRSAGRFTLPELLGL